MHANDEPLCLSVYAKLYQIAWNIWSTSKYLWRV